MPQNRTGLRILFCHFGIKDKSGFGRTYMLAKGLAEQGSEVTLLTNQNDNFKFPYCVELRNKLKIVSFPDFLPKKVQELGFGSLSILLKMLFVTGKKFDIVHSDTGHRPSAGYPCRWNRFLYHSKYISEWWDYYGRGGQYDAKNNLFKMFLGRYENKSEIKNRLHADGVVVLSRETFSRAIQNKINKEKMTLIHGGADVENIKYQNRTKYRKNGEPQIMFGYIGMSDSELDDLEPFIKAFAKCSEKINIGLLTFGKKISSRSKATYGLSSLIELGWINYANDSRLLHGVDVFVLIKKDNPSNRAGWPNKLGDYLAAGRPVLLNPYGELNEFIKQYPCGIIKTDYDAAVIEDKIVRIYDGEYDLDFMGKYNRVIAENEFSWHHQSAKLGEFYNTILNR